jgi:transcriptional regulator with XRE-family HTH domain
MLGEEIRRLRLEKKWTQQELGSRTGLGRNVSSYETGHLKPSLKTLKRFADALGTSIEELSSSSEDAMQPVLALNDEELLALFKDVSRLPETDVDKAKWFLNLLVKQHRLQQMIAS